MCPANSGGEYIQSLLRHFLQAISRCKYPFGLDGIGIHLQNLMHLLFGQPWIMAEQVGRILEGGLQVTRVGFLAIDMDDIIHDYSRNGWNRMRGRKRRIPARPC